MNYIYTRTLKIVSINEINVKGHGLPDNYQRERQYVCQNSKQESKYLYVSMIGYCQHFTTGQLVLNIVYTYRNVDILDIYGNNDKIIINQSIIFCTRHRDSSATR